VGGGEGIHSAHPHGSHRALPLPVLQTAPWFQSLPAVRNGRAVVVDGNQMFNRPARAAGRGSQEASLSAPPRPPPTVSGPLGGSSPGDPTSWRRVQQPGEPTSPPLFEERIKKDIDRRVGKGGGSASRLFGRRRLAPPPPGLV